MKRNSTILFSLISLNAFAQFPSPTNFSLQGQYIELDRCELCLSSSPLHDLCGPTYCTAFSWQAPTETTAATLDHYNIYGKYDNQIVFSATEVTLYHWVQIPPQGDFWVTAVYSNPIGESLPSNVVTGWTELPTSNSKIQSIKEDIVFSKSEQTLTINSTKTIVKMNLIDSNGRIIKCFQNPSKKIYISEVPRGFYIIEAYCEKIVVLRQKIIK